MNSKMKYVALSLIVCSLLPASAIEAQSVQFDSHAVQLQEGKMLTVRVRPGARKIEVVVRLQTSSYRRWD
jgi:hypothetical protein